MEETVHDLTMKMIQRKITITNNSKDDVQGCFNIKTNKANVMYTFFIQIYLIFLEILKGCLMMGCTKMQRKNCTRLVGSIITLSMMMYPCCVIVVDSHNLRSFMTDTKKSKFALSIYGKLL